MEQRRLRLGDILDDYCPRERRVTNHVIVAMIEDDVKQTRCSTCDADHEYKQARVPSARRKKEAGVPAADGAPEVPRTRRPDIIESPSLVDEVSVSDVIVEVEIEAAAEPLPDDAETAREPEDDGPVHRRLIRATLPRPEGQVPERKETEFTVRQQGGQGGRGREIDGNRPSNGHNRHRRPPRPGERPGETRFGGAPQGNSRRGGGQGGGGGRSQQGQPGGNPQGGQRSGAPGGGEGRFRRRRGR